ncbi:MAG: 6-carboxy-5,6,7,8-tetrahydropterin synthase [Myxococcaceae bacterium]
MEMSLSVDFHFSAAHALPFYDGPCKRLHGHNYVLRVTLTGRPQPKDGMIRDFDEVKKTVWDKVLVKLDHYHLNEIIENPTAENLVVWMWERLAPLVPGLQELKLWETPEYCVTYRA